MCTPRPDPTYTAAVDPPVFDVIGLGANSIDHVAVLPAMPEPRGERAKMRLVSHVESGGGQVLTAMATCAALGLRARYVGAVGDDEHGRRVRALMTERGLDTSGLVVREGSANQFAIVLLDGTGERIVLWSRDERLADQRLTISPETLRATRLVHLDDVDPESSLEAAAAARALGLPVTSDIDRTTPEAQLLVDRVTIPILAEHVPAAMTGRHDPAEALPLLHQPHHEMVVVTLGECGSMAFDGRTLHHEGGFTVNAVDTTGSGDVFRGAFIYGRLRGWPVSRLLRFANAAAAVACTRLGALAGVPSRPEIDAMLATGRQHPAAAGSGPEAGHVT